MPLEFLNSRGFFPGSQSTRNPSGRCWRAHCDAALKRMVSVDHAGKLFERIEANAPAGHDKRYRNNNTGTPPHSASFCPRHGNCPLQGAVRSAGRISFVTFLWPPKKSKRGKPVNYDPGIHFFGRSTNPMREIAQDTGGVFPMRSDGQR